MQQLIKTFGFLLIVGLSTSFGQRLDFAVAARNGFSPSLSFQKVYGIGQKKNLKIGWGVRANAFFSNENDLITAPYKLTSGKPSIIGFFTEYKLDKLDTLSVQNTGIVSLNSTIILEYSIKKLDLGFNIDAFGFTVGAAQKGLFSASQEPSLDQTTQNLKPTAFNLLLVSDSDIGSLNSELFARYWLSDKSGLRIGLSFQFIEYKADQKLTYDNDRFRLKTLMPMIGYTHRF
ncbi:hypothetical protein SAMN06298216_2927 [Spirosomataceae bacterium TFI 002]|nr:hypothetical protein SAMN06298216_2927 [Spirosomataceae bacterium TFI 002]